VDVIEELENIEKRLDRLERTVFLLFQDVRDVADYTYESVLAGPEDIKRAKFTQPSYHQITDREAMEVGGLAIHELAALKMNIRLLRKQSRRDILGMLRNIAGSRRKESPLEKVA